jgi:hypothetical protein
VLRFEDNDANVCVQTVEPIVSSHTAEKIPCTVWHPVSPRYGWGVVRLADLRANTIRPAQPEGHPGAAGPPPPPPSFNPIHRNTLDGQMSREQELGLNKNRKKFDVREEYFVSLPLCNHPSEIVPLTIVCPRV